MVALVLRRLFPIVLALGAVGCFDFQPDPPAGPSPVRPGRYVDITVIYRQPAYCANADAVSCAARVVFRGSWMANDQQVLLDYQAGRPFYWTGVVQNVPVNWPPSDQPHYVSVFDPHLVDTPSAGATAARLEVGGQAVYFYDQPGTAYEAGLIYVDDSGVGHNPL